MRLQKIGAAEYFGLALLAAALLFNANFLAPELSISKVPLNDSVFHRAASERLGESLARGEPFLDPWVSEWSLGYPVWRTYQPLPHLIGAAFLKIAKLFTDPASAFALLQYFALLLLPASFYCGARMLGFSPAGAGLSSLLVLAPSAAGNLGAYGIGYGATTWRGSGLFTQVISLHFLALSVGFVARALDSGKRRLLASLGLALTALSHLIFGYVAFVSAATLTLAGPKGERSRRLIRLAMIAIPALLLMAWFVVPLFLGREAINHSRWEAAWKWESFGARFILSELLSGRFFDAGRAPLLSILLAIGAIAAAFSFRETLPRRLLILTGLWLALFFGRETWGHLLLLAGIPADLHLHRFQAAFEMFAVLLGAWGIERAIIATAGVRRWLGVTAVGLVAVAIITIGVERASFLHTNANWGAESLAAYDRERGDLEAALADVCRILGERAGRVSAGKAATWGKDFKVGSVPVYAFLTREHMDQVSFLYHAMSLTSDLMVLREEENVAHDEVFGVRAVVAPSGQSMPEHLKQRAVHGRFTVYESAAEGYFSLVDIGGRYTDPHATTYEPSAAWLKSPLLNSGVVIALDDAVSGVPAFGRWEPLPEAQPAFLAPRGRIVSETKEGETYRAHLALDRPCYALVKVTWHPDMVAMVDGARVSPIRVTPGFAAVPVPAGEHGVEVRYEPGAMKSILLIIGIALFALSAWALPRPRVVAAVDAATARLSRLGGGLGERFATTRAATALALLGLSILAAHPLFRGRLVDGHDVIAYPPRLVEMTRVLSDGHAPPVWSPDLGNGYGQPLFEFAPPLVTLAAVPFHMAGMRLADSLQIALALLYFAGGIAVYRLGRRMKVSRASALAGAGAWLFAPYVSLDFYVRGAFAEAAAVVISPIALLGLLRALDRPTVSRIALAGAGIALIPLAHNATALLMIPAFALLILFRSRVAERPLASLASGGAALLAGLCLSAFFWLPALLEKSFVKLELAREGYFQWSNHTVSLAQLLWSSWGYGVSGQATTDGMSLAIGPLHLILGVAGIVYALRSGQRARREEIIAFAVISIAEVWLATTWSQPLWERVDTLQFLQFPWRALMLPALFLPLLGVFAFERVGARWRVAMLALLVIFNLPHTQPKGFLAFDDQYYAPPSIAQKGINTTTREEYEPRWVETRPPYRDRKLTGLDALLDVREAVVTSARQEFIARADADTRVEAATFYYPGWIVTVGGQEVPVSVMAKSGTIVFRMPPGEHRVVLELLPTALRHWSLLITLATGVILFLCIAAARVLPLPLRALLAVCLVKFRLCSPSSGDGMPSARDIRSSLFTGRMAAFLGLLVVSALLITVFAYRVRIASWKGGMQPEIVTGASQDVLMQAGLDLLYTRRDPAAAAVEFRKVLALNPAHYGATYQLAVALDQAGKPAEARPLWEQALRMSEGYNDKETADTA